MTSTSPPSDLDLALAAIRHGVPAGYDLLLAILDDALAVLDSGAS